MTVKNYGQPNLTSGRALEFTGKGASVGTEVKMSQHLVVMVMVVGVLL